MEDLSVNSKCFLFWVKVLVFLHLEHFSSKALPNCSSFDMGHIIQLMYFSLLCFSVSKKKGTDVVACASAAGTPSLLQAGGQVGAFCRHSLLIKVDPTNPAANWLAILNSIVEFAKWLFGYLVLIQYLVWVGDDFAIAHQLVRFLKTSVDGRSCNFMINCWRL